MPSHRAAVIPQRQMEEFIYLYESMPYNIELMNRPLEDYLQKKQRIRITAVSYTHLSEQGSPMAKLRKENGREKPWKVKFFGVRCV